MPDMKQLAKQKAKDLFAGSDRISCLLWIITEISWDSTVGCPREDIPCPSRAK